MNNRFEVEVSTTTITTVIVVAQGKLEAKERVLLGEGRISITSALEPTVSHIRQLEE